MILTDKEREKAYEDTMRQALRSQDKDAVLQVARAIESAVLEKLKAQGPYEIEYPEYHQHGMGCGLEDRNITDRYKAMAYGWDRAIDAMAECIPDRLYEHPLPPADVVRDAERLEWLLINPDATVCSDGAYGPFHVWFRYSNRTTKPANTARAAIDAAMKEMK